MPIKKLSRRASKKTINRALSKHAIIMKPHNRKSNCYNPPYSTRLYDSGYHGCCDYNNPTYNDCYSGFGNGCYGFGGYQDNWGCKPYYGMYPNYPFYPSFPSYIPAQPPPALPYIGQPQASMLSQTQSTHDMRDEIKKENNLIRREINDLQMRNFIFAIIIFLVFIIFFFNK